MRVCLLTTATPVDYEASDGEYVDIFFALLVPQSETERHLTALAELATIFAESNHRQALRDCTDAATLLATMTELLAANTQ